MLPAASECPAGAVGGDSQRPTQDHVTGEQGAPRESGKAWTDPTGAPEEAERIKGSGRGNASQIISS